MDILVWNVCGIRNERSIKAVNNLVQWHRPSILVLVETKVNGDHAKEQSLKFGQANIMLRLMV